MVALQVMRDALVFDLTVHPQRRHARACRGHPRLSCCNPESKTWMAGTSPAMTVDR
jgi:hypothetical protein